MQRRPARPVLALASAPGSLARLDRALGRHGIAVRRIPVLSVAPRAAAPLLDRLDRFGAVDTVLLTSPEAVDAFVARATPRLRAMRPVPEFWTVGPETARRMRRLGIRSVRRARVEGLLGLLAALRRQTARSVLYPRSDRAGPDVARRLRARGDRVLDLIAYSVRPVRRISPRARDEIEGADAVLVTSPSALGATRALLGETRFRRLRTRVPFFVLGRRTARSARAQGCRDIRCAPSASVQALTYYVRRGFRNGPS
ncbi:MAG: uroporphyrinogen-III synthase [Thermoplasmata archaeon]